MPVHDIDYGMWTPKLVGDELLEAVRWANRSAGPIGPARVRSAMPDLAMILTDRDFEGWPPIPDLEAWPMRRAIPPARVSQLERALWWQARYLADQSGPARVLKHWVRARLTKGMTFGQAIERRGWSRPTAYRARDRALAIIAMGLTDDDIVRGQH
ncbi:hypothetical protein PYH37_002820 [Sinorhizobium numidicum]|uniref:Uncharacterized protein n=1 Tax=Sinorhizobium numidicum TaxID=680248 RepID=A0ABY8D158_9HYPH|nr:hypothetical protein [Sinorhizobium numidicum]WEX77976.1 hypothetical protein PYH37_002820 [Sinorhizobium numidicum]WEX84635.1 hypothetical protein PYH38_003533 [Sinorhizobium numidicum]